jgi:hypothetical protein
MPFKKHDWTSLEFKRNKYNRRIISGEVVLKEGNRPIDKLIFNDNNGYRETLKVLKSKYGFEPEIKLKEEFEKEEIKEVKKDIDFFKKDMEF